MRKPDIVRMGLIRFYDVENGVAIDCRARSNHEWFVQVWYKTESNVVVSERVALQEKEPTAQDVEAFLLKHKEELDRILAL